jgi:hypothetical protein
VAPWIGLTRGLVGWGRVRLCARPRPAPKAAGDAPPRFRPHPYDHGWAEDFMARSNGPRSILVARPLRRHLLRKSERNLYSHHAFLSQMRPVLCPSCVARRVSLWTRHSAQSRFYAAKSLKNAECRCTPRLPLALSKFCVLTVQRK